MINKKKIAAITAVEMLYQEEEVKQQQKISWTDHRVGWTSQPRFNWNKQK